MAASPSAHEGMEQLARPANQCEAQDSKLKAQTRAIAATRTDLPSGKRPFASDIGLVAREDVVQVMCC
jgi:hypothetical protein